VQLCPQCGVKIDKRKRKSKHVCGEHFCKLCSMYVDEIHSCFVKPTKPKRVDDFLYIIFDVETMRLDENEKGESELEPNLICVSHRCYKCKDVDDETYNCAECGSSEGGRDFVYYNIETFINHVLEQGPKFTKVVALSHNGSRFDTLFVARNLLEHQKLVPHIIAQGQKIMQLTVNNIIFRDTFLFMGVRLADLPATLGLNESLKKGDFPHLFNTSQNQNYVGLYPKLEFYDIDSKSEKEGKAIAAWHHECVQSKKTFDFQKEILEYCKNDVRILTLALIKFANLIEVKTNGVQCFLHTPTIAACSMKCFRSLYLQENCIPIIPPLGFHHGDHQSKKAREWLKYIQHEYKITLRTAENGGEAQFKHFKLDGYDKDSRTGFEFYGCYWHGHTCLTQLRDRPIDAEGRSLQDRYDATIARKEFLENSCGVKLIEQWECDWDRAVKTSPEIQTFLREHCSNVEGGLCPKDAFKGGRTECFRALYKCDENEFLEYKDVTSLYPWVMSKKALPTGEVKIHNKGKDMPNPRKVHGLVFCKVLPPCDLAIPLLPYNAHNRLIFGLCRTCMDEMHTGNCNHSEEERAIRGVFCTPELHAALDRGYVILDTYEIWEMEMTEGLFKPYVNNFLKMKQESSGFPPDCITEEQKQNYISDYARHEGIDLEYDKIGRNEGLRYISKIFLNSLFGKWGQRCDLPQTKVLTDAQEFNEIVMSPNLEIQSVVLVGEKLLVTFKDLENRNSPYGYTNLAIASFISSWARLRLYEMLDTVGIERVLYCDTDSIIYIQRRDEPDLLPTGNYLGELTREIKKGWEMRIFYGAGPKNYAYQVEELTTGKIEHVYKIRGITLTRRALETITFEHYNNLISEKYESKVIFSPNNILRKPGYRIVCKGQGKRHCIVNNKRRRLNPSSKEDYHTLPYGYRIK